MRNYTTSNGFEGRCRTLEGAARQVCKKLGYSVFHVSGDPDNYQVEVTYGRHPRSGDAHTRSGLNVHGEFFVYEV